MHLTRKQVRVLRMVGNPHNKQQVHGRRNRGPIFGSRPFLWRVGERAHVFAPSTAVFVHVSIDVRRLKGEFLPQRGGSHTALERNLCALMMDGLIEVNSVIDNVHADDPENPDAFDAWHVPKDPTVPYAIYGFQLTDFGRYYLELLDAQAQTT